MSIPVTDLTTLTATDVEQSDALITSMLQELNPDVDVAGPPLFDLLVHPKAVLDTATQTDIDRWQKSSSLQAIEADPTLADTDIVATLLSNSNIVANEGTKASGTVTVVLTQLAAVVIPVGSIYTIDGRTYETLQTYAARTSSESVVSDTDVLIEQLGAGQYGFNISVTATDIGSVYNATRAATATPDSDPPKFLKAFVTADFSGGTDPDTVATLITKLEGGQAVRALSSRPGIEGLIRNETDFANVTSMSIIGLGDEEMLRDMHTIWPGHTGGRMDVYMRSQPMYALQTVAVTATLISKVGAVGTWQFSLGLDDAPGFYKVDRILLQDEDQTDTGFQPTTDTRTLDLVTPTLPPPDLVDTVEGVYSRYQAATITFADTTTDATSLTTSVDTHDYNVVVRIMPLLAEVQDFLSVRSRRPPGADVLIKAPLPCFTTLAVTVNYDSTTTEPDATDTKNLIADAVNGLGFVGSLSASFISQTLHANLTNLVSVTSYTIAGSIRKPDGTTTSLSDSQHIDIPDDPDNMVTGRTTVFFLRPTDITLTLVAVDVPNV